MEKSESKDQVCSLQNFGFSKSLGVKITMICKNTFIGNTGKLRDADNNNELQNI